MRRNSRRQRKPEAPDRKQAVPWQPSLRLCAALLLAVVAIFASIRIRLRDVPLERDQGEYAYAGQLILQGIPPYQLAYNMKLPGTYAAYALIMAVLGQTAAGIHLGVLLINASTIVLMFFMANRLFGRIAGLVAAASYGLLSTSFSVNGLEGHATHFVVLPAVAGLLAMLTAIEHKKAWLFFLSGILLGMAFLMKQPGIFFAIFAGLYLLRSEWTRPIRPKNLLTRFGLFALGVVIPYGLTCLILWRAGVFSRFWFWTFSYARHYGFTVGRGLQELSQVFPLVAGPSALVWLMAAVGLTAFLSNAEARRHSGFCMGFLFFSFLAVCLGFRFTPHYFIMLLPAVSLLVAVAVSAATSALTEHNKSAFLRIVPITAFLIAFAISIFGQRELLFEIDPVDVPRAIYGMQPFPEALQVGEYLRSHSAPNARIAVLGSEPEIYFYAHRQSATGYIYTYALMEEQPYARTMQQEMISEIEAARPQFVVLVNVAPSWLDSPKSNRNIFTWMQRYLPDHYEPVGVADIQNIDHTEYRWAEEASHYRTRSPCVVWVLQRKA
ncbi:MAG: glycosyltransferase family 39 protein [Terriglobales bacterium]